MSIEINNHRIINFFNQRPEMDIETMILKFIDIMENLQENMNKTLTNTTVIEILDNIKGMNKKIDDTQNINRENISKQILEIKHTLIQDIQTILCINMNEKLEPKMKEQQINLVEKITDQFEIKLGNILEHKMSGIRDTTLTSNNILSNQNNTLQEFLKRFENSSKKGKMSENALYNTLSELYPTAEINSVGQTKETGDIMLIRNNKPKILIENKEWTRPVVQSEVIKFIRDIEVQGCNGIFLSQNGTITTKDNFEVNIHDGNILVYIHEVNNDADKIKIGVDIIDTFSRTLKDVENDISQDMNTISKEITHYINVEYTNFVHNKTQAIKKTKESTQMIIKHIEEMNFPTLEKFLSTKFSSSSNKFICEYCGFSGKNQQSKSAHMRGCLEKKKVEATKKSDNKKIMGDIFIET